MNDKVENPEGDEEDVESLRRECKVLKEQNRRLEADNSRLKTDLRSSRTSRIVVEKEVKPNDYERLKATVVLQQKEIEKLRDFIDFGSISTLENLIRNFQENARVHLAKIIKEIHLMSFSKEEVALAFEFIDYLENIRKEIYSVVAICDINNFSDNPRIRMCISDLNLANDKTGTKSFLFALTDNELEDFHALTISYLRQLEKFKEKSRKSNESQDPYLDIRKSRKGISP